MRRLYICPKTVWLAHVDIFHPSLGSHYIDLGDGLLLISAGFRTEGAEEVWHSHQEVAILPHPTFEGAKKLGQVVDNGPKKVKAKHLNALRKRFGADVDNDTVLDLSDKAKQIHPLVKVSGIL